MACWKILCLMIFPASNQYTSVGFDFPAMFDDTGGYLFPKIIQITKVVSLSNGFSLTGWLIFPMDYDHQQKI
jgi:hypothetical protein